MWKNGDETGARILLATYSQNATSHILSSWWKLSKYLYLTYNDGYYSDEKDITQPLFCQE